VRIRAIGVALAVGLLAASARAHAEPPDKQACVAAFDRGQRAQSDRAFRRAQGELIVCAQESCPTVLRADCAGVLAEVRAALPTIVFAADDGEGHELTDVRVFAGDELLVASLDGRAVAVDPGSFELRFEQAGRPPLRVTHMFREGEKSRVVRVSLPSAAPSDPSVDVPSPPRTTLGWALPGSLVAVGVAGLVVSFVERRSFDSRVDDLRGSCAPDCTQQQRADLSSTLVVSNVALGVGVGALTLAVVSWFVTAPRSVGRTSKPIARASSGVLRW
jgi:hypothetical protein